MSMHSPYRNRVETFEVAGAPMAVLQCGHVILDRSPERIHKRFRCRECRPPSADASAEYVLIRGAVFRMEDKVPFENSGYSIKGAFEFDPSRERIRCHHCGDWFKSVAAHLVSASMNVDNYRIEHGLLKKTGLVVPSISASIRERTISMMAQRDPSHLAAIMGSVRRSPPLGPRDEYRNSVNRCDLQITEQFRSLSVELGRPPLLREFSNKFGAAGASVITQRLGGIAGVCNRLGIDPNPTHGGSGHGPIFTKQILIDSLRDFYARNGRLPRCKEYSQFGIPSMRTYTKVFGSMANAYVESGFGHFIRAGVKRSVKSSYQRVPNSEKDLACQMRSEGTKLRVIAQRFGWSISKTYKIVSEVDKVLRPEVHIPDSVSD